MDFLSSAVLLLSAGSANMGFLSSIWKTVSLAFANAATNGLPLVKRRNGVMQPPNGTAKQRVTTKRRNGVITLKDTLRKHAASHR